MEAKDRDRVLREILEKYPGTDPEIDIDWNIVEISFKVGREEERRDIIQWLKDLGVDEYMIARLNNELIIKSLSVKPH